MNYDNIIVAVVVAVPPTLVALSNRKAVKEVHLSLNSRLDQMLTVVAAKGKAEGKLEEAAEAKTRQVTSPPATDS